MKKLKHPFLVQLYEVIDDEEGDKLYLGKLHRIISYSVMDFAEKGEVMSWNSKTLRFSPYDKTKESLGESQIKKIMRNCIRGLRYSNLFFPLTLLS
jgi:serine/threonine protein kinase